MGVPPTSGGFAAAPGSAAYGAFAGAMPYPQPPPQQAAPPTGPPPPMNGAAPPQPPPGMPPPPPGAQFPTSQPQQPQPPPEYNQYPQANANAINPMSSPGPMGNGMGSGLSANASGYTSLSTQGGEVGGVSAHTAPTAAAEAHVSSAQPSKKNVLIYDDENQSPVRNP